MDLISLIDPSHTTYHSDLCQLLSPPTPFLKLSCTCIGVKSVIVSIPSQDPSTFCLIVAYHLLFVMYSFRVLKMHGVGYSPTEYNTEVISSMSPFSSIYFISYIFLVVYILGVCILLVLFLERTLTNPTS